MDRHVLRQRFQGVIGVTVTPVDDDYEVDYGRMAELTKWWVENGLVKGKAMLKVNSVMGEGPQLRDDEWPALIRTAVQAADGKVDVIAGTHCKDTKRTIEDSKKAEDLGAIGLGWIPLGKNFEDPESQAALRALVESISGCDEIDELDRDGFFTDAHSRFVAKIGAATPENHLTGAALGRVVLDLARQGWSFDVEGEQSQAHPPDHHLEAGGSEVTKESPTRKKRLA